MPQIPLFITFDPTLIDSRSILVTIVGYCLVFLALAIMGFIFAQAHRIVSLVTGRRSRKPEAELSSQPEKNLTGDENAAICTALYLYFTELHDQEKYVMTVKKVSKTYSPWSSKIYGVMQNLK